ncbi:nucleotidyltransferase family protein [Ructibacterium gallinarum]|uniref:Nucleotidyltransferase n=1 Tax=Ructibacterium gallinarum TaxID=2779355 RepID=A0A9D5R884_9FIRM|nr:sugar phosphate nucleotidyltransferase [Ructibacterium gallinarum]MBE5039687.1 nucleotidyltransferase [Ructibacterium gallinarum]
MSQTTLVALAAGMGSRFGGLKQMAPVAKNGAVLLDFSVFDAATAGFDKVVFIIKEEMYDDFKEIVGSRIKNIEVDYAFQETNSLPAGRTKPWGTGHAILCCRDKVKTPFAVINADDYYGRHAYQEIHSYLTTAQGLDFSMVAFDLKNTLTENGTVARGICEMENGYLKSITERTKIQGFKYTENGQDWIPLPEDTQVSMNLWGFTPEIFDVLDTQFKEFYSSLKDPMKDEFFIPFVVDRLIQEGKAKVKVFHCRDKWYGMTYREDLASVRSAMNQMIEEGYYEGL